MGKAKSRNRKRVKSVDWRPAGFSKAEWRIIQMAKHAEKGGNVIRRSELKELKTKVDQNG